MANYRPIVIQGYREILKRDPDPSGLEGYNTAINEGKSEADFREDLLRSDEYVKANPNPPSPSDDSALALHVEGNRFVNTRGEEVKLLGSVICCADADVDGPGTIGRGWTLVDEYTLDEFASYRLNYTNIRLGPSVKKSDVNPDGEPNDVQGYEDTPDGRYDLTRFNQRYWDRARAVVAHARKRGIYVEVDLIDVWVLDHQFGPFSAHRNIQGFEGGSKAVLKSAPLFFHSAWIRKAVRELGGFSNVLWQDGNESFKGASEAWVLGMQAIVRDEENKNGYPHRPFGTNTQDEAIEAKVDYAIYHEREAQPSRPYPVMTNEYADIAPEVVIAQAKVARSRPGVAFHYWRGGHNTQDYKRVLSAYREIIEGTAAPIPDHCPPLVKWGLQMHNIMDANFQPVPKPVRNGRILFDSTERFGSGNGKPCNAEHNVVCGGRECEDPDGGIWRLESKPAGYDKPLHIQNNGFQARVDFQIPGHYAISVGPRPDVKDHYGKPVEVVGNPRTTLEWDVL